MDKDCPKTKVFIITLLEQLKFSTYFCAVKRYYRHITLWLCLPSLLLSTSGFSLHTLYCLCKSETQISLFFIPDDCEKTEKQQETTCCTKNSACSKVTVANDAKAQQHQHDCSKRGLRFAKLNTPYLPVITPYNSTLFCPALAPSPFQFTLAIAAVVENNNHWQKQHFPLARAGMELRRFLKSYRC